MGTLIIQLSLYSYLISICVIELNVLRIFQITNLSCNKWGYFLRTFKIYLFSILDVIEGTKGIISYFHPFQCYFIIFICMTQDKNGDTYFFIYFIMFLPP
jgi:hypothetical protein